MLNEWAEAELISQYPSKNFHVHISLWLTHLRYLTRWHVCFCHFATSSQNLSSQGESASLHEIPWNTQEIMCDGTVVPSLVHKKIPRDTSPSRAPTSVTHESFNVIVYYSSHMFGYSRCQSERGADRSSFGTKKDCCELCGLYNHGTYG